MHCLEDVIGDDIFEGHEHGKHVALVHGTGGLDAFGHLAEVDVARGLHMTVVLRSCVLVTRVDTRGYGIGYVSCHSSLDF